MKFRKLNSFLLIKQQYIYCLRDNIQINTQYMSNNQYKFSNEKLLEEEFIDNCHSDPKNNHLDKVYKNYSYQILHSFKQCLDSILQSFIMVKLSSFLHCR